jgi:hypothetical protein
MEFDRICDNRTPMAVHCVPMEDRWGSEVLVVIAKMTWDVSAFGAPTIARPNSTLRLSDEKTSDDPAASARYPSDLVEEKPGTDVLLVGTAYPSHAGVTEEVVSLRVEACGKSLYKVLKVYGPRVWQRSTFGLVPGPAARMAPTPLIYELAYGGVDASDSARPEFEPRNPAGTGFLERRTQLAGCQAPVIEDPREPLSSRMPAPAGFGPILGHWSPRTELAGTRDDIWQRERAPLRPLDFDPRHHCCAPQDQWTAAPLVGDEPVEVLGATPEGRWQFRLPRYAPIFVATVRGRTFDCDTHLDTYLIDADRRQVELTWRAKIALPRKTEHLEKVVVFGSVRLPDSILTDLAARVFQGAQTKEAR